MGGVNELVFYRAINNEPLEVLQLTKDVILRYMTLLGLDCSEFLELHSQHALSRDDLQKANERLLKRMLQ